MDMHGPEQFVYYLILFKRLVQRCNGAGITVRDMYVDFNCRLKKTWDRFLRLKGDQHLPQAALADAKQLRLLVNWMHGSSHELSCQLQNNGRYTEGAGHRDGEGSERLWAQTKVSG